MKFKILYIVLLCTFQAAIASAALLSISGKITDASTKNPLAGATVSIPDLKISVLTNSNGEFIFNNVPAKGKFLLEIKYIGYKTVTQNVDFGLNPVLEFALQPSTMEVQEVVVTGSAFSSSNKKNSTSVSSVSKADLVSRPSANLIDAISKVPGVSQITTGNGISKPVIRGLSYNRVVTLSDGVKQEGQQWGDEHGVEVDQFSAERVEVLRGAASLLYGSDALGGVINIIEPLPAPQGTLKGEVVSNYSSNNGLSANSVMLSGNTNGFVYRVRGSYKNGYSFKTPTGYFPNSGLNETDVSGQLGFNKSWGFAHLNLSSFRTNIGFYEPAVNSGGSFVDEDGNTFSNSQFKDRTLAFPRQDVRHYKAVLNSNILLGGGSLKSNIGYQHNLRRELDGADLGPELFLDLHTYNYDFKYYMAEKNGWEPVIGTSGQFQNSNNTSGLESLIPDYTSNAFGGFAYLKKTWTNTTFNAGLRFDYRILHSKQFADDGDVKFSAFDNSFSNISGAFGFTHEFTEKLSFKANAGTAFRAPNIAELASNGVHEGAYRYEIGNSSLKPERGYQLDGSFSFENEKVSVSIGGFINYIDQFIYYRNINNETIEAEGSTYPVYHFVQDNALFRGGEASLILHPASFIHFENTFSYTRATNQTVNSPVPFIPAASMHNELRFEPEFKGKKLTKSYLSIALDNAFAQNRVDVFETISAGYSLLNAGIGTTLMLNKQPITLYVAGRNLLDKKYYDHLSRYKPGRLDETDPTFGVYNPGRNITVGIYVPFVVGKEL